MKRLGQISTSEGNGLRVQHRAVKPRSTAVPGAPCEALCFTARVCAVRRPGSQRGSPFTRPELESDLRSTGCGNAWLGDGQGTCTGTTCGTPDLFQQIGYTGR